METKKSKRADLEHKRGIFLEIGLIIALGLVLAAFEWKSPVKHIVISEKWNAVGEDIVIKNTFFDEKKPVPIAVSAPFIHIVENLSDDSPITIDAEIKPAEEIPVYTAPITSKLEDEKPVEEDIPYVSVQEMPEFPGAIASLKAFLAMNIDYPSEAVRSGITGTVYVYFVVEKDGKVSNIKTLRGISMDCDKEAERVISILPQWKPGSQQGKAVRVSFTIPVIFNLK